MNVLVDTGFWFAYYDNSDSFHQVAVSIMDLLDNHNILIPFPSLYETINTRFSKKKKWMEHFKALINNPNCTLISDDSYKEMTLELSMNSAIEKDRAISMVDMIIRQMLDDVNLRSDALITFNPEDFADVCRKKNKVMISDSNIATYLK